jgi:putative transposase
MLHDLTDEKWELIKDSLSGKQTDRGRTGTDNRGFIRALMCMGRTRAPWHTLPIGIRQVVY